jgi:hypothetical protein
MVVGLSKNGRVRTKGVHRLVAETFIPCNDFKLEVNHIDGNKENNCMDNLEWVTSSQNTQHALSKGLFPQKKVMILETGNVYSTVQDCANSINGDIGNIYSCMKGRRKTHKGLHFVEVKDVD